MRNVIRVGSYVVPGLVVLLAAGNARAVLQDVGPTSAATSLPTYYRDLGDAAGAPPFLALAQCLDQNGMCVLTPGFDPTTTAPIANNHCAAGVTPTLNPDGVTTDCYVDITTTGPISDANFPDESFYFLADNVFSPASAPNVIFKWRAALEAAFLFGVAPGEGITFLRINWVVVTKAGQAGATLTPNSTYTVTHPYGTFTFATDANGEAIPTQGNHITVRLEDGAVPGNYFPADMQTGLRTHIGPFLKGTGGFVTVGADTYLADPAVPTTVVGSPFCDQNNVCQNSVTVTASNGTVVATSDQFTLAGKVYTAQIASKMSVTRDSYSRDAAGAGQVEVFAQALPTANLSVKVGAAAAQPMTGDGTGKFFGTFPFSSAGALPAMQIINSLDVPALNPPSALVPGDGLNVTQVAYDPVGKKLYVKAASRDLVAPPPTLTVRDASDNAAPALGTFTSGSVGVLNLASVPIPPESIEVTSARGGFAIAQVAVVTPGPAPVAVDDAVSGAVDTAVLVNVIGNDTGSIDPATVVIASAPAPSGTAVANSNGTATFTPAAGFTGQATFTYTISDIFGRTSAPATVTVTVNAAATGAAAPAFDFNGDGKSDVLWKNGTDMYMWLMNADGTYTPTYVAAPTVNWSIVAVADFDGDGNADLLWRDSLTTDMYIWFMNGAGMTSFAYVAGPSLAWSLAAVRDFNADGKTDLLWRNGTDMYIWFMNGASFTFAYVPGPAAPWQTVP